jgi:hypothetical protein
VFKTTHNSGFHITFPNGITVSTQFGAGNYCDNHFKLVNFAECVDTSSSDCEIGIWRGDGAWCTGEVLKAAELTDTYGGDVVIGYVSPMDWLKIVNAAASLPKKL